MPCPGVITFRKKDNISLVYPLSSMNQLVLNQYLFSFSYLHIEQAAR